MPEQLRGGHTQVILQTHTKDLVGYIQVPAFDPPADVVQWGSRNFVLASDEQKGERDGQMLRIYREGMMWVAASDEPTSGEPFTRAPASNG